MANPLPSGISVPEEISGLVPVLPISRDGSEGRWQWTPEILKERLPQGRVRIGGSPQRGFVIYVLKDGEFEKIERGEFLEVGRRADGSIVVDTAQVPHISP